jgi:hypothetical protein
MEPQQRRPRPDLGCSAIGWMDGYFLVAIGTWLESVLQYQCCTAENSFKLIQSE